MNKYLNKRYQEDLTEFERMSMHQPATFDSTSVTKKVRMSKKKSNRIKTTREEARFFDDEPSKPKRKRIRRPEQEHAVQRDLARPVQRKDPKYKNAAEVGIEKARQKRAQPGTDWIKEVVSPPTKKVKMIVAENELPTPNLTKSTKIRDGSSKKPQLKSKKVTNKSNEKVTKPPNQLNKSRPRSKSRNNARPSKSDKNTKSASGDKNAEKPKNPETESEKPKSDSKKISQVEEFRRLLAEQNSNTEREHVRESAPTSTELPSPPIIVPLVQQRSVLDELGFSSSQESNGSEVERQACKLCKIALNNNKYCSSCSSASETEMEPEIEPETIVRMEIQDEQPTEIIEIADDEDDIIPPMPPVPSSFDDTDDEDDDDDVIFVSSSASIQNLPSYHDPSTGQTFCYGQDLDDF